MRKDGGTHLIFNCLGLEDTHHFCSQFLGQELIMWSHLDAEGRLGGVLMGQLLLHKILPDGRRT